jgi:hypothetical protein
MPIHRTGAAARIDFGLLASTFAGLESAVGRASALAPLPADALRGVPSEDWRREKPDGKNTRSQGGKGWLAGVA